MGLIWKKLLLGLLSICPALLLAEWSFARYEPQLTYDYVQAQPQRFYSASDRLPYALRPNLNIRLGDYEGGMAFLLDQRQVTSYEVTINSQGFRDTEFSLQKPADTYRIAVIGDSFTFGFSVDNGYDYPSVLERCLQGNAPHYEVLNAGLASSYSPDAYYVFQKTILPPYEVDMILVGYLVGTDPFDMLDTRWVASEGNLPLRVESKTAYVDPAHRWRPLEGLPRYNVPLLRNSHLYQFLLSRIISDPFFKPLLQPHSFEHFVYYQAVFRADFGGNQTLAKSFQQSMEMMRAMANLAKAEDQAFAVLLLPNGVQSDLDLWEKTLQDEPFPVDPQQAHPQQAIRAFLDQEQIPYLDLLPSFREASPEPLYLGRDGHWSIAGNSRAGQAICDYLIASDQLK